MTLEIVERAPAKINLALHVTGHRDDGYHMLDSLVTFAAFGDELVFRPADDLTLALEGPEAGSLSNTDNLVLRAAHELRDALADKKRITRPGASIKLHKNLPVSSGVGGGSADAAATLRGLMRLWDAQIDDTQLAKLALSLGADVPMCLTSRPSHISGIGEEIAPVNLPVFDMVLINPRQAVSTPDVFKKLDRKNNASMSRLPKTSTCTDWTSWLDMQRNDLQAPATNLAPEILDCLEALRRENNCLLARMSGSGATCFGIYESAASAEAAAQSLRTAHPDWWVVATRSISWSSPS